MSKGKLFLMLSAFLYGVLPMFASIAYRGGINGITLTLLRSVLSLPLLYIMIISDKKRLHLTKKQQSSIVKLSLFGGALPILSLYLSYNYISTGLATTLHFIYPLIIVISGAFIYHKKLSRATLVAVLFVTIGIFMFSDINTKSSKAGIILALLSGVFYSFYLIYIDHSGLDRMDYVVLTFYVMLFTGVFVLIFGMVTNGISFDFSLLSWSFAIVISLVTTIGAMPLLQIGIRYDGPELAGIFSAIEPITTIVLGGVFFGEIIGTNQIIGGLMVIFGVLLSQHKIRERADR